MHTGIIQVNTYIAQRGSPVGGAVVEIYQEEGEALTLVATTLTDPMGKSAPVTVQVPAGALSQSFEEAVRPYAEYTVRVQAEGYYPITIEGVEVFENKISIQSIEMVPDRGDVPIGQMGSGDIDILIPPHTLFDPAPNAGKFVEGPSPLIELATLRQVVIPETIVVHLGSPDSSAKDVFVPFKDYIKNVASSEIYPTWDEQALLANIYAIISFTLNRVYTEWYRSRGYNFQITSTTAYDQAYIHGRNIYEDVSRIVDEVFNQYLHRPSSSSPFFSSYCDGRQVNCDGLKQWGSQELAQQGRDFREILSYYYGDLAISEARQVEGIPLSYPGQPLSRGEESENIRRIQGWLTRIGENYPAIGVVPPTGVYDERTEEAVKLFQRTFHLTPDGVVGFATWYRIVQIYVSVTKLGEIDAEAEQNQPLTSLYPGSVIRKGQQGANVRTVQSILALLSAFFDEVQAVDVDGVFDEETEQAVKEFQALSGLVPDGLVGKRTWDALQREYTAIQEDIDHTLDPFTGRLLSMGSRGANVEKMQTYLNHIAAFYPSIPSFTADGQFGKNTKLQVQAYQRQFGLPADGIIGRQTWRSIVATHQSLSQMSEAAVPAFGEIGGMGEKHLIGPSYPPVGYDPPFTLPQARERERDGVLQIPIVPAKDPQLPAPANLAPVAQGEAQKGMAQVGKKLQGLYQEGVLDKDEWTLLQQKLGETSDNGQ